MKALVVGFGSIGRRHCEVLRGIDLHVQIDLVTRQHVAGSFCFASLAEVPSIADYDYFLICSETSLHLEQLTYLDRNVSGKPILVEKPLFAEFTEPTPSPRNRVFVGYNLRFHPVLAKLKELLEGEAVVSVNIQCGQYLPGWRPGTDYTKSYSASAARGGGVLRDLSHELDYLLWLFGPVAGLTSVVGHFSQLKIDSDDMALVLGQMRSGANLLLTVDYLSHVTKRRIEVYTQTRTLVADLVAGTLTDATAEGSTTNTFAPPARNLTYEAMHRDILSEGGCSATYLEALRTLNLIQQIENKKVDYRSA